MGAVQSRGATTRQKIIDSAVELFADRGYAHTGLTDITSSARITTGAFYYHFESKEALAAAIIEESWPKTSAVLASCSNDTSPGLECVIAMTYSLSDLMRRDKSVRVTNHLNQAMGDQGRPGFQRQLSIFIDAVTASIPRSDIQDHITPRTLGEMVWMAVHGCQVLADALMDGVFHRLTENWRVLLPSIVSAESVAYFQTFLTRTAGRFEPAVLHEESA